MKDGAPQVPDLRSIGHAEPGEIWKARAFIHEQFTEPLSLGKVAQAVRIRPHYLSERFKKVTGQNFVEYVNRYRVQKAYDLLLNSQLRISEIAFAVGFQSLSQFNRVFKKFTTKSPSDLRASLGNGAKLDGSSH